MGQMSPKQRGSPELAKVMEVGGPQGISYVVAVAAALCRNSRCSKHELNTGKVGIRYGAFVPLFHRSTRL